MAKIKDLTGMKFGRLTVLEIHGKKGKGSNYYWKCVCDCGRGKVVSGCNLKSGSTRSCGCLQREARKKPYYKHGKTGSRVYGTWCAMLTRCRNRNTSDYTRYGGRGIKVCERWESFENFYADMGDPPPGMSLDRIDNNGDYTPENCRWATRKEQNNNQRSNHVVEYKGEEFTIAQLAEKAGMTRNVLRHRLERGWSLERAVKTPVQIS